MEIPPGIFDGGGNNRGGITGGGGIAVGGCPRGFPTDGNPPGKI